MDSASTQNHQLSIPYRNRHSQHILSLLAALRQQNLGLESRESLQIGNLVTDQIFPEDALEHLRNCEKIEEIYDQLVKKSLMPNSKILPNEDFQKLQYQEKSNA